MPQSIVNLLLPKNGVQKFMDSAQSIEFNRAELVATSMSRSGRVTTQTRNTVKPWVFKVTPVPLIKWEDWRDEIEEVFNKDRHTEWEITLGDNVGSSWMSAYQGSHTIISSTGELDDVTCVSASGNQLTINVSDVDDDTYVFKRGDIIQPTGSDSSGHAYRYPYVVSDHVFKAAGDTTKTITLNRPYLVQSGYTLSGKPLYVGNGCTWHVVLTSMPSIRFLPGKFVEFTGMIEMVEVVV